MVCEGDLLAFGRWRVKKVGLGMRGLRTFCVNIGKLAKVGESGAVVFCIFAAEK